MFMKAFTSDVLPFFHLTLLFNGVVVFEFEASLTPAF
jgi:hypothetical protein